MLIRNKRFRETLKLSRVMVSNSGVSYLRNIFWIN